MTVLSLTLQDGASASKKDVAITHAVIAGWTGRNRADIDHHIEELAALGIPRPKRVPIYFRMAAARATTASMIEVLTTKSSGEVEFVMVQTGGKLWIGVGSDHTDRDVETYGITVSKHMCDHPVSSTFWSYDSIKDHWDKLILRAFIMENGKRVMYQEGSVASMLPPLQIIEKYTEGKGLQEGTLMFGGTFAAIGGVRPADKFEFELEDPVNNRKLSGGYDIVYLPIND